MEPVPRDCRFSPPAIAGAKVYVNTRERAAMPFPFEYLAETDQYRAAGFEIAALDEDAPFKELRVQRSGAIAFLLEYPTCLRRGRLGLRPLLHLEEDARSRVSDFPDLDGAVPRVEEVLLRVDQNLHGLVIAAQHAQSVRAAFLRVSAERRHQRLWRPLKALGKGDGSGVDLFRTSRLPVDERERHVYQLPYRGFRRHAGSRADTGQPSFKLLIPEGAYDRIQVPRHRRLHWPWFAMAALGRCLGQERSNRHALGLEELRACHGLTNDPVNRRRHALLKTQGCRLTLARAGEVPTAVAGLRGKTRRLHAVTLDEELEPGPQFRIPTLASSPPRSVLESLCPASAPTPTPAEMPGEHRMRMPSPWPHIGSDARSPFPTCQARVVANETTPVIR